MAASKTVKNDLEVLKENKNEQCILTRVITSKKSYNLKILDLAVLIFSAISIVTDFCTDLVLVFQYSSQGYKSWAVGTFVLIFLPSIIVQFFSLRWHIIDNTATALHWVFHFCMSGIFLRYIHIIRDAFTAYKTKNSSNVEKVLLDQSDLCMLHLFESFLESAPQLVLQIYVIVTLQEWRFWTVYLCMTSITTAIGVSALASLLSLAWALAAYTKAQRRARPNKNSTTWPGLLLQAIWRTGMLTSRISTLVLGVYCFGNYIFLIVTLHWIAMTIWIIYQKTDFCETYWEERLYNAVVGVIYCFCFFNLQEGQSRWRALGFYLVIVFQNLICLTIFLMWFGENNPRLAIFSFIAVVGGTLVGSVSMLLYYRFFHPSGPIKFILTPQPSQNTDASSAYSTMTLRSLKRLRSEFSNEKNSPKSAVLNESNLSSSVIIVEDVLDDSDVDLKILQNWINETNDKPPPSANDGETVESEANAYKRRPICSSVGLEKLIESKVESETGSLKVGEMDEISTEILSAHDYENLCAVNIAREIWGLRSWRGYCDIETWLHDDSVVQDRRLDTLTSTTSSDRSANLTLKGNESKPDDYGDGLIQCESEISSDDVLGQFSIESFPISYPLGPLDPIFEEIEEVKTDIEEFTDVKINDGSASTLVATIDEIRRNTPTLNRYLPSDLTYNEFSPLSEIKPKNTKMWKKVTFASKLLSFSEDDLDPDINTTEVQELNKTKDILEEQNNLNIKTEENTCFKNKKKETEENVALGSCEEANIKIPLNNKENIPTVASKITHWNTILNSQNEKNLENKTKITPPKSGNVSEKKSLFLLKILSSTNFPSLQRRKP